MLYTSLHDLASIHNSILFWAFLTPHILICDYGGNRIVLCQSTHASSGEKQSGEQISQIS